MLFIILISTILMAAANYEGSSDNYKNPQYGGYGVDYDGQNYKHHYEPDHDKHERKLKKLKIDGVDKATVKYYKHRGNTYAVISCPPNPDQDLPTWILVDSEDTIPTNGKAGAAAIAVGTDITTIVKLRNNKYQADNVVNQEKQRFKRVGCYQSVASISN